VNARVSGQLIRSTEALAATSELTGVRLFSSVCSNVSGLMFQAMEMLDRKGDICEGEEGPASPLCW
jgi:hypothetical protein